MRVHWVLIEAEMAEGVFVGSVLLAVLARLVLGMREDLGVVDNVVGQDETVGADNEEGHDELVDSDRHAELVWVVRDEGDGPQMFAVEQKKEEDELVNTGFGLAD